MTHESGIEAAFNVFDRSGFFPHDSEIEAAIQAYLSASGMVLVPREPTEEMMVDGVSEDQSHDIYRDVRSIYSAMLEAAPNPLKSKP